MKNRTTLKSTSPACPRCPPLDKEIAALRSQLDELREENGELREENDELKKALEAAQRAGKRQAAPFSRGQKKKDPKKPGRKKGHPGATRAKPDRVDRTLEAPPLESCPDCGDPLEDTRPEENYETDIPEEVEPVVTRFVFKRGWCARCKQWVYSRHPEQSSTATGAAASHLGPRVRALAADLKCRLGIPFRKIQELLEDQLRIRVTAGALVHSNHRLAKRAKPTEDAMKEALANEQIAGADETGWRIAGESYWLWVVCSQRLTVYEITSHRNAKVVREILGEGFKGFLMRDGWSSYDAQLVYRMLRCLLHLRHNAEKLEDAESGDGAESLALFILWIDGVFELKKQHRGEELSEAQYQERAGEMIEWYDEFIAQSGFSSPSNQRFAETLEKIRDQIVPILEHPELPATNNQSERQIRPPVVHRKISAGNKTEKGASTLGRLAGVAASCRQNQVKFADVVQLIVTSAPDRAVNFWEEKAPTLM